METDSLYLAPNEKELEDCIKTELKAEWKHVQLKDSTDSFIAEAIGNFSHESVVTTTKKNMTSENLVCSKKKSGARKCCVSVVKLTAATTKPLTS